MIIQGGTIQGGRITDAPDSLYQFSTFTFTNANVWGRTGPTLTNCQTSYGNATFTWLNNSDYFTVTNGIQLWTVPRSGTYTVTAYGAQGAPTMATAGGVGAVIQGDFALVKGDKIKILVGQSANIASARLYRDSSGGGGSFVVKNTINAPTASDILVIAGGGAGTGSAFISNANASITSSGKTASGGSFNGVGGTGGAGGGQSIGATANGAGGGFTGNGASNGGNAGGRGFIFGGAGGDINTTYAPGGGGFGGGGAPNNGDNNRMGGGGGYSGGGASDAVGNTATSTLCGGGGGSYNNGTNQSNQSDAQGNFGNGKVIVTFIG